MKKLASGVNNAVNIASDAASDAATWVSENASLVKQGAIGATKVVFGGLATSAGVTACATGLLCVVGGPAALIGGSEMIEGGGMLKDTYSGVVRESFNPLRTAAQQVLGDKNGTTAYDIAALSTSLGSLSYKVPLVVGLGDGMNRAKSINGVVVTQWQNSTFVPGASLLISVHSNQAIQFGSNAYKAVTVAKDINKEQK